MSGFGRLSPATVSSQRGHRRSLGFCPCLGLKFMNLSFPFSPSASQCWQKQPYSQPLGLPSLLPSFNSSSPHAVPCLSWALLKASWRLSLGCGWLVGGFCQEADEGAGREDRKRRKINQGCMIELLTVVGSLPLGVF